MTLTELRYIVTLAQEQHFGRAAERCHVSQPTLSIAVKKLEQELDVALFERSKTRVQPTPLGERIVQQAQLVLEQTAGIRDLASAGRDQLNATMSVGAIFTIGPYLFPRFIPHLQELAPRMPLFVEEGFTATLRQRLRKGELDAIIVSLPFTEADVVTQPLYDEPFEVLLPAWHPLARKESISEKELAEENLLLLGEGHCFRDQVLLACPHLQQSLERGEDGARIRTAADGSSLETIRHMVASGLGITILPRSAAVATQYDPALLVTRPLAAADGGAEPKRTVALAWRASFPRHRAIELLRDAIHLGRKGAA
ncbi:hydrogen peroxide-inducible genes activator [Biformimicrobium ophioploci]|uniref:Hydrogen peroxide-inducible genes activator n=1 Tax=Biformimicrobium ophioploci TaxID=3036711 RepID=A0ABQ6LVK5_9GAMM|nr:hydrogen peroxide-inducible genes activator [Microbulbifer sp. NKW57]GMG86104.1 hydrogen peroxide-inducible genes activator [Microbulbifer sp. NKW57]